jgi:hypothetical protein
MTRARSVRSVPFASWPLSDRVALEQQLAPDDDGSGECGRALYLSEATITSYRQAYGQFLDFLARTYALCETEGPGDRATPQQVAAWRKENKARGLAPTTRRNMLRSLGAILRLMAPNRDWSFVIRPGGRSLKRAIRGGPKPVIVRDAAEVMVRVRQLHRLGLAAADEPEKWRSLRDAAVLAILLSRAPRLRSLAAMTMNHHIELQPDGRWHLRFPGEHTKNGRMLDFRLDAEGSRTLTDYLEHARPRFPRAGTTEMLWMGMRGSMTREGIQAIAERHTLAWYGQVQRPHAFRKWLRASAARRSPELAMDSADVMGHTAEVSVKYYSEASSLHAALRHADRLAERRARQAGRAERAFAVELARWKDGRR